ncbi:uncharacterized protein LOC142365504 [Opisthocomus hoazin]|uniref:uncharacterized protein LOC142365504 n=1 Tax=Opisthocomus hoazin TaxID=30419 RepID=UPI003F53B678
MLQLNLKQYNIERTQVSEVAALHGADPSADSANVFSLRPRVGSLRAPRARKLPEPRQAPGRRGRPRQGGGDKRKRQTRQPIETRDRPAAIWRPNGRRGGPGRVEEARGRQGALSWLTRLLGRRHCLREGASPPTSSTRTRRLPVIMLLLSTGVPCSMEIEWPLIFHFAEFFADSVKPFVSCLCVDHIEWKKCLGNGQPKSKHTGGR